MGNSRAFTRNRHGSPGKSRRRAAQQQRANWDLQSAIDRAGKSAVDSAARALTDSGTLDRVAASLATAAGITHEEAKEMTEDVLDSYDAE